MKKQSHRNAALTLVRLLCVAGMIAGLSLLACSLSTKRYGQSSVRVTPAAVGDLPLPTFDACDSTVPPLLPDQWEAVTLMQDFIGDTLVFGKFTFDVSVGAFRSHLVDRYGLGFDLMVTSDGKAYLLFGDGDMPSSCVYVSDDSPFTVPNVESLGSEAECVGQAPILTYDQQWWKDPRGKGANWYWFHVDTTLPFRQMFYADPTDPAPIYESWTFNYFPTFEGVNSTNLGQILQMCQASNETPRHVEGFNIHDLDGLLRSSDFPTPHPDSIALIQSWIPGLSECSSIGSLPPAWPDQVQLAAFVTAVSPGPNPFPARVYYDWTKPAQNTTLYDTYTTDQAACPGCPSSDCSGCSQVALLTGNTGYIFTEDSLGNAYDCKEVLPGPQVPNWNEVDGCECRMQIAPGTVLNPGGVSTKILWCPTDLALNQVFWTWYTDDGDPVVFMQSNSSPTAGTGLNLADYYGWSPGSVAPSGTFTIPTACNGVTPPVNPFPQECHNCHLPLNARFMR